MPALITQANVCMQGKQLACDLYGSQSPKLIRAALTFRRQLGVITVGGFLVCFSSEDPQTLQAATDRLDNPIAIPAIQQVKQ